VAGRQPQTLSLETRSCRRCLWAWVIFSAGGFSVERRQGRLPDFSATYSPSHADARLARIISALAGREAAGAVLVARGLEETGPRTRTSSTRRRSVGPPSPSFSPHLAIDLSPELSIELSRLANLREPVWEDGSRDALAYALHAPAHESVHVGGDLSDGGTLVLLHRVAEVTRPNLRTFSFSELLRERVRGHRFPLAPSTERK
jgi:hypothetical protein